MLPNKVNMNGYIIKCLQCSIMSVYEADKVDGYRCPACGGYTIPYGKCYIGIDMGGEKDEVSYYVNGKRMFQE